MGIVGVAVTNFRSEKKLSPLGFLSLSLYTPLCLSLSLSWPPPATPTLQHSPLAGDTATPALHQWPSISLSSRCLLSLNAPSSHPKSVSRLQPPFAALMDALSPPANRPGILPSSPEPTTSALENLMGEIFCFFFFCLLS